MNRLAPFPGQQKPHSWTLEAPQSRDHPQSRITQRQGQGPLSGNPAGYLIAGGPA